MRSSSYFNGLNNLTRKTGAKASQKKTTDKSTVIHLVFPVKGSSSLLPCHVLWPQGIKGECSCLPSPGHAQGASWCLLQKMAKQDIPLRILPQISLARFCFHETEFKVQHWQRPLFPRRWHLCLCPFHLQPSQ